MERRGGEKQLPICAGKLCNTTCRCDGSDGSLFCQLNAFAKKQICPGKDEGCTTTMPMMRQTTVRITAARGRCCAGEVRCNCSALKQVYQRVKIAEHNMQNNNNNMENNSGNTDNKQAGRTRREEPGRATSSGAHIQMQITSSICRAHTSTHPHTPTTKTPPQLKP